MADPLAQTQIELGALRMVVKALVGRVAIDSSQDAAGANQFVERFRERLLADVDQVKFNFTGDQTMTAEEARELTRRAISEAVGGMTFSD